MIRKVQIASLVIATTLTAQNVFTIGKTYDFAEKDLIVAIQEHINSNKEEIKSRFSKMKEKAQRNIDKMSPVLSFYPPPATANRIFYPDTKYTNPQDIKDHTGKILYPAGYTFDPVHYVNITYDIVIINGKRDEEINWLKNNTDYIGNASARIIITEGEFADVTKKLGQSIFFATDQIISRLSIEKTPSIIKQDGNRIAIEEIYVESYPTKEEEE
jgi:conjugal transfer pilus assembly protein TraW